VDSEQQTVASRVGLIALVRINVGGLQRVRAVAAGNGASAFIRFQQRGPECLLATPKRDGSELPFSSIPNVVWVKSVLLLCQNLPAVSRRLDYAEGRSCSVVLPCGSGSETVLRNETRHQGVHTCPCDRKRATPVPVPHG
jgi:hypothetical protein